MAIGKFDGLHLGHRDVLRGCDTVCTFDPHPLAVLKPEAAPRLLTDVTRRAELAATLGVRELVVLRFDDALRRLSPEAFVDEVLVERLGARHVSVGESFRFGHRAQGTPELLRADGRFGVRVVPPVTVDGAAVSSTRVRAVLAAGAVAEAAMLLGAPHALRCAAAPDGTLLPPAGMAVPADGTYRVAVTTGPGRIHRTTRCTVAADGTTLVLEDGADALPARPRHVLVHFLARVTAGAPAATATAPRPAPASAARASRR